MKASELVKHLEDGGSILHDNYQDIKSIDDLVHNCTHDVKMEVLKHPHRFGIKKTKIKYYAYRFKCTANKPSGVHTHSLLTTHNLCNIDENIHIRFPELDQEI